MLFHSLLFKLILSLLKLNYIFFEFPSFLSFILLFLLSPLFSCVLPLARVSGIVIALLTWSCPLSWSVLFSSLPVPFPTLAHFSLLLHVFAYTSPYPLSTASHEPLSNPTGDSQPHPYPHSWLCILCLLVSCPLSPPLHLARSIHVYLISILSLWCLRSPLPWTSAVCGSRHDEV